MNILLPQNFVQVKPGVAEGILIYGEKRDL